MSGRAGFSDDFHQRVLFTLFNSSLNEDHVLDTTASSQHGQVMKRNATPSDDLELTSHVVTTADLELSSLDLVRSAIKRGGTTFMDDLFRVKMDEYWKLCESFTKLSSRFSLNVDEVNSRFFFTVYYIDGNWEMKRNIWFLHDEEPSEALLLEKRLLRISLDGLNLDESLCSIVWPNNDDRDKYMKRWGDILGRVPFGDNFKGFVSLEGYIDYVSRVEGVGSVSDIIKDMLGHDLLEKVDKAFTYVQCVLYDNKKLDLLTGIRVSLRGRKRDMSYFRMMMCALEYKEAFLELEHREFAFKSVSLTKIEWEIVTAACDCLEVLNDVTCSLSSNKYRTANSCIHLILNMYKNLLRLESNDSNPYSYKKKIASRMRDNFVEGYWKGNSLVLSIAAFLDPRFKMDLVRDWYNIIYPMEGEVHISRFVNDLKRIYNFYANVPDNPTSSIPINSDISFGIPELESYLGKEPPDKNFEILAWWRNSTPHFSTLARMAREFLAVPICEVNFETKDDIMKTLDEYGFDPWLAFEWTKFWLQYSHHEVQILENPPSYHGQGITKTRQGNASINCVSYEMVNHTVRQNTSNTPYPKQTREYWSKVWNDCTLNIPNSYKDGACGYCGEILMAQKLHMHLMSCPAQTFFKEGENLDPFIRSDLATLVDTKKKFKVHCELDGLDLARMTLKLGYTAFVDDLLCVYKEEKQKAAKYLNELSCPISLGVSNFYMHSDRSRIITVQFIDEVWKLQRKILCLEVWKLQTKILCLDVKRLHSDFHYIGISPQQLNARRNLCSIVYSDDPLGIERDISRIKDSFHDPICHPFFGNFQGILSLSYYINELISYEGAQSVGQKMENIVGCDIFKKLKDCYQYAHKKFPHNDKFGKMPNQYKHQSWGIALEFRETFLELEGTDLDFKSMNLTNKEWDALTAGYNCLKVFKDVTSEHLSGKTYTTANICLPLICDIYKRLQGLHLIYGNNDYICQFPPDLKQILVKEYWDKNGLALAIAAVLDPRFKMDVVEEWYNLIYGNNAEVHIQRFTEELRRCYNCYGDGFELDLYLRAPKRSIYDDFGILTWWRDSTSQFPTLARMARDILAIPVWSDTSAMNDDIERMLPHVWNDDICNDFILTASWLESLKGE